MATLKQAAASNTQLQSTPLIPGAKLLESLRASGYTYWEGSAELFDNMIDAQANNCWLEVYGNEFSTSKVSRHIHHLGYFDDGNGMTEDILLKSFALGTETREYDNDSTGKFSLGGTNGAISIARQKITITRSEIGGPLRGRLLDLDKIEEEKVLLTYELPEDILEKDYSHMVSEFNSKIGDGNTGTAIFLSKLDRLTTYRADNFINQIQKHFGKIYYSFITKRTISMFVDNKLLEPLSPILMDDDKCEVMHTQKLTHNGAECNITVVDVSQTEIGSNRNRENHLTNSQGMYFVRNGRLIASALCNSDIHCIKGFWNRHPNSRFFRVLIEFDSKLDDSVGVGYQKKSVCLQTAFNDKLQNIITPFRQQNTQTHSRKQKSHIDNRDTAVDETNKKLIEVSKSMKKQSKKQIPTQRAKRTQNNGLRIAGTEIVEPNGFAYRIQQADLSVMGPLFDAEGTDIRINIKHPYMDRHFKGSTQETSQAISDLIAVVAVSFAKMGEDTKADVNEAVLKLQQDISQYLATVTV